ncbi:MAG: DinB family protein [Saprospiraceae bacterium]|nr:DinB family protein [Saprospiraceae bacterium]
MPERTPSISRPQRDEYPEWYAEEIERVPHDNLLTGLEDSFQQTIIFLRGLNAEKLLYRYQPEKWTIKEIWQHVIDTERVLSYRAMRFARGDKTVLQGFDQNKYAEVSKANARDWEDILREYSAVRESSLMLFRSFDEEMWMRRGTAGRSEASVRAVGFLILGHETHHVKIIRERYLN